MNCIDCEFVLDCKKAEEGKRDCKDFKNAHRKIVHIDMDYAKEIKEILE